MTGFKDILTLIKLPVALLSTLSAAVSFIIIRNGITRDLFPFSLTLLCLAAGSAALNQWQEYDLDKKMARTRHRPIATGTISKSRGLVISLLLMIPAIIFLWFFFGKLSAVIGIITVLFYNGVYTPLKKITPFAALPGALVGALPPVMGWTAAGGDIMSPNLPGLVLFFYLWQVPHFWLLLGKHGQEYRQAGLPGLDRIFSPQQLARLTFTWILATGCSVILLPLFGFFTHTLSLVLLLSVTLWLAFRAIPLIKRDVNPGPVFMKVFKRINIFAFLVMIILIMDHGIMINK